MVVAGLNSTIRGPLVKMWRDFLSVYYANTPTWRWLKSGALVFLGFFAWMGGSVLLSVQPQWGFLTFLMAYGFLLLFWGPFTHLVVVPVTIRLRRTADHSITRTFSRNSGKINLTIFFTLVVLLGTFSPSIMMLEFSPDFGNSEESDVSGDLVCDTSGDVITCHVENPERIDHITVESGGETLARADDPPYRVEFSRDELSETRTGLQFQVTYRDEDGNRLRRFIRTVQ